MTSSAVARLHQRLTAVATVLLREDDGARTSPDRVAVTGDDEHLARAAGDTLHRLVTEPAGQPGRFAWFLLAAVSGHLPTSDEVVSLRRALDLARRPQEAAAAVLDHAAELVSAYGAVARDVEVVRGRLIVDVDTAAKHNRHTGIQRVTREVCSRWAARADVSLVVWDAHQTALRRLAGHEASRVLRWRGPYETTAADEAAAEAAPLVLPWECTIVLPEVAQGVRARSLAALAEHSGNDVVAVGYDAIPVTSADLRPFGEADMYVRYLDVLKHCRRIAAISASAAAEFEGAAEAIRAQGLRGPDIVEVTLAAEVPGPTPDAGPGGDHDGRGRTAPTVLVVGSHDLHKNHLAVLHAAELLWREGLHLDLVLVGGPGSASPVFDAEADRLRDLGRSVHRPGTVSDDELWRLYRTARFTVFPSLHEGFGLPVAESLACGTPAVTTDYGSTAQIAAHGGCLLIDPRDDHALADAMRTLLTDEGAYVALRDQARRSPVRTWQAYADDLWSALVTTAPMPVTAHEEEER